MNNLPENDFRIERLTSQIYNQILGIVYDRGIVRTEKLSALNLSKKLGVSRTPVSFALYRMELEGLISGEEKGGWIVNPVTLDDLDEILETKASLFPLIVELATAGIGSEDIAKLFIFLDEINRSLTRNDLTSWRSADKGFNKLLQKCAGNQQLSYFEQVLDNQLYRVFSTYFSFPTADKELFSYYQDIASAISCGNAVLAGDKAREFVVQLRVKLKAFLKEVVIPLLGPDNFGK